MIISNTGYTGAGGFELYFNPQLADHIWDTLFQAGQEHNILPIGLGARDTLRLEMGYCLYGNDIDDTTSPIEAGLGWITKFTPNNNFIDRPRFEAQQNQKTGRRLRGFEMIDKGIPRHGYQVFNQQGQPIGQVTSGTQSPMLKKGIGMAYVLSDFAAYGSEIFIGIRGQMLKARIVKLPIYKAKL
jgi:aminomethyltransferase